MRDLLEGVTTLLLVVVALTMLGFYLSDRSQIREAPSDVVVEGWEEYNKSGIRLGPEHAPIVITEFMDFTCPYCRQLAPVTDSLHRSFPNEVAVVFQHFPLRSRPFSMELAMAAECAFEQDHFWVMYRVIYSRPRIRSHDDVYELGRAAELPDMDAFSECLARPEEFFHRILDGREIGREVGVVGTPAVWLNGRPVDARSVEGFVEAAET